MAKMMGDRSGKRRNAQTNFPGAPGSTETFVPYGGNGPGQLDQRSVIPFGKGQPFNSPLQAPGGNDIGKTS